MDFPSLTEILKYITFSSIISHQIRDQLEDISVKYLWMYNLSFFLLHILHSQLAHFAFQSLLRSSGKLLICHSY